MKENPRWNHLLMRKYSKTDQSFVSTCRQLANQLMVKDPIHPEESSRIPKISFAAAEPPRCCSSHKMSSKFEVTFSKVYLRNLRMQVGSMTKNVAVILAGVRCSQSRLLPCTSAVSQFMLQTCLQRDNKIHIQPTYKLHFSADELHPSFFFSLTVCMQKGLTRKLFGFFGSQFRCYDLHFY